MQEKVSLADSGQVMLPTVSTPSETVQRRDRLRLLALAGAGLCAAIALLSLAGRGALATPPLVGGSWRAWLSQGDPIVMTFAGLRLLTLGVAWYLLVATLVGLCARAMSWRGLIRLADAATVPALRRLLQSTFSTGLATAVIWVGPTSGMAASPSSEVAAVLTAGEPGEGAAAAIPLPFEPPTPEPADAPTWTVQPGDHFWSIAERLLSRSWDRRPTDDEISRYWTRLIDRNTRRLVDRDNPDLLVPGQVLEVPAPAPRIRASG